MNQPSDKNWIEMGYTEEYAWEDAIATRAAQQLKFGNTTQEKKIPNNIKYDENESNNSKADHNGLCKEDNTHQVQSIQVNNGR